MTLNKDRVVSVSTSSFSRSIESATLHCKGRGAIQPDILTLDAAIKAGDDGGCSALLHDEGCQQGSRTQRVLKTGQRGLQLGQPERGC